MNIFLPEGQLLNNSRYKLVSPPSSADQEHSESMPPHVLGKGGFGITYMAKELFYFEKSPERERTIQHKHPQNVVIKEVFLDGKCKRSDQNNDVIVDESISNEWVILKKRLKQEGNIIDKFDSAYIVKVRSVFEENGTIYTVMEYIESHDLDTIYKLSPVNIPKALKYTCQLLTAVEEIHRNKIYHFDIKPSNVLIDKKTDAAVLIDFGAALAYNSDGTANTAESQISKIKHTQGKSVPFCPQEIENNLFDYLDIRTAGIIPEPIDLYSVGATLFACVTGQLPPRAALLTARGIKELRLPDNMASPLNDELLELIKKAMATESDSRFQSAREFKNAIYPLLLTVARKEYDKGSMDDYRRAFSLLKEAVLIREFDPEVTELKMLIEKKLLKQVDSLISDGRVDDALSLASEMSTVAENNISASSLRESIQQKLNSLVEYKKWYDNGVAESDNGNYQAALACFEKANIALPDNKACKFVVTGINLRIREDEEAIEKLRQGQVEDLYNSCVREGQDALSRKNYEKAIECFKIAAGFRKSNEINAMIQDAFEHKKNDTAPDPVMEPEQPGKSKVDGRETKTRGRTGSRIWALAIGCIFVGAASGYLFHDGKQSQNDDQHSQNQSGSFVSGITDEYLKQMLLKADTLLLKNNNIEQERDSALACYIKANEKMKGGKEGYRQFMSLYSALYSGYSNKCDSELVNLLKRAREIDPTSEVNLKLAECQN